MGREEARAGLEVGREAEVVSAASTDGRSLRPVLYRVQSPGYSSAR